MLKFKIAKDFNIPCMIKIKFNSLMFKKVHFRIHNDNDK